MKILVLGAKGMLGGQLMKVFGNDAVGWDRSELDVTKEAEAGAKIKELKPDVVINCAAYNDVDGSEQNRDLAFRLNEEVPRFLSSLCRELNIIFVHFSTNYVFDGEKEAYSESSAPNPLSVYAQSKYKGEEAVEKTGGKFYLIRTSLIFGPKGESELSKKSFVEQMLKLSETKAEIKVVNDEINSITYAVDLAGQIKLLLSQSLPYGIYHITNSGSGSWYDFAKEIFAITKRPVTLTPIASSDFPHKAIRPKKAVLINTKLPELRPWQEALKEFLNQEV